MNASGVFCGMVVATFGLIAQSRAADDLLITEFMASNSGTLLDEDGDASDWIEIHNAGTNSVNLNGWFLTDKASDLTQWGFPGTNCAPNGYLIVFASGKNRRVPGAPLHTSFQLKASGEYLALVRPDGTNIASAYSPVFAPQVDWISYGMPVQQVVTTLLPTGAVARVRVPTNDTLGASWTTLLFDDSTWTSLTTGVGYATPNTSAPPVVVADSVADWSVNGVQGEKNWYYGYYNKTADTQTNNYQAGDFVPFPRGPGPFGASNYWNGAEWKWWSGSHTDEIDDRPMQPNGTESGDVHWVIRRWRSTLSGSITVDWTLSKLDSLGSGVTARVLHNGNLKDSKMVSGTDVTSYARSVVISNVLAGDAIDIALDPVGSGGAMGGSGDRSLLSAVIRGRPNLTPLITSNIAGSMSNVNASVYLRIPFQVSDAAAVDFLTLRVKYDDGFIAYLNGQSVVSANAPMIPEWNSTAVSPRSDAVAIQFEEFNLTAVRGVLQAGTNVLAIHGLNASAADTDFLILPELIASHVTLDPLATRYFAAPTPGAANGYGATSLGPLIVSAVHSPNVPKDNENVLVTAQLLPTFNPISSVSLIYRVSYSNEANVPMFDDGAHGDGAAGDGVFGGSIPASASQPGEMVRYYVFANDTLAGATRFPPYSDPQNTPQYQGTVIFNPGLSNPLPVIHMFVQDPALATNYSGTRGSIFYDDEFYDNVEMNLHGQTTTDVFEKRSFNIDMNSGYQFRWRRDAKRVHDFKLITTAADKAHVRQVMAYETFTTAGVPSHFAFPVRLQQNNALYGVMHLVENGDDEFLDRVGLDPNGALYKIYLPLDSAYGGVAEKKTRKNENNSDLQALINGCTTNNAAAKRLFLYDNVDIPELINFLATIQVVQNEDCCEYKNYYLYRDSDGTGEWQMLPWDLDLTLGRSFTDWVYNDGVWSGGYYDTNIFWMNRWYSEQRNGYHFIGDGNPLADALWRVPEIFNMFLRRWSTVQEELLQQTNTHPLLLKFERRVDELAAQIAPDAAADLAKWGTPFPPTQTLPQAAGILKTQYFAPRRGWIFDTLRYANGGPYLGAQPSNAVVKIASVEFNPASGNQAQEYIHLTNSNAFPVDISGWKITGAIDYTFRGGVVIPTNGLLYVSPDVKSFRARTTGPRGGQGLLVQGNYPGQLSARGGVLQLNDRAGRLVSTNAYAGNPSLPQQYLRVTEIMYHPAPPPPGIATNAEEFEFVEIKNIGPVAVSLVGVRFTNGIEFNFTGSGVTGLAAGATAVVVRNLAAFTSRYGAGVNVAGQYLGALENTGENIRLDDASGEKILDFTYDNQWYPITDGLGFSLVTVNENAPWDTWGLKASWRPSRSVGGSPGQADPVSTTQPGILITEAFTHSVPPAIDQIELYNPTAGNADINGWYLTDDFLTPKKFRIHDRPVMPTGGYLVFDETDFNAVPGAPGNFSLSSKGDEVYLFSADPDGNLTGYYHGFAFGAAESGVSFGRHVNSVGQEHFVAQTNMTLGTANSGPRVGPVVISELHYRPPDLSDGSDNAADEFIELMNITSNNVSLFDPLSPTNTWHLRGGVDFEFSTNVSVGAGNFLLVVNFDPIVAAQLAAFQSRFGVPAGVPVFGPYRGKLDNASGSVMLSKPDAPVTNEVPYILVDEVDYADSVPWPQLADGVGASLQRLAVAQYGNDPSNWTAATPTAGLPYGGGSPPVILTQPAGLTVLASGSPTLGVNAVGTAPLRYQWHFQGTNLPGATNASLTLANVLAENAGAYEVVVFNNAGSVLSSNALLTLLYGAYFTSQPTNSAVTAGANALFSATVTSSTPVQYQWRLNGTNLAGATNSSLTVANVQPAKSGFYQVIATDSFGSLPSAPALLTVLGQPVITAPPQNVTVTNNSSAVFNATATGTAPLLYQWRFQGTNLPNETSPTLAISYAQPAHAGDYTLVVSNSLGSTSAVATLTVLVQATITVQPQSVTVTNGGTANFSVTALGTGPLGYQWRLNGGILPNANSAAIVIPGAQPTNAGSYTVVVSNSLGSATSAVATLTVLVPPFITTPPTNQFVQLGSNATFEVLASGTMPLSFQWQFGVAAGPVTNINEATNATLLVSNALPASAGNFSVVVTNLAGSATSAVATLTLIDGDADGDGMSDLWEYANGLDPFLNDAADDPDHDGMTNLQEYLSGTDPHDADSYLKIDLLTVAPGERLLSFMAVANKTYTVQYRDALATGNWLKLADVPARATNQVEVVPDPSIGIDSRFYRLVTPTQP